MSDVNTFLRALRVALRVSGLELREDDELLVRAAASWPDAMAELTAAIFTARINEQGLRLHADALKAAAASSDKHAAASNLYADKLAKATWVLAFATILLFLATALLAVKAS